MASFEYRLPALPLGGSEVTISRWLKRPGDTLAPGEPLLIVLSARAEVMLPSEAGGALEAQLCAEGDTVAVGAVLATLAPARAAAPREERTAEAVEMPAPPAAPAPPVPAVRCTPVARRIAVAHDLELRGIAGRGVSGRVVKADVLAALERQPPTIIPAPSFPAQVAAEQLPGAAFQGPPDAQVISVVEVDLGAVSAACARELAAFARRGLALAPITFVLAAVVELLPRFPLLNGWWDDQYLVMHRRIDLSVSAAGKQLRLAGAQDLNLRGLARALQSAGDSAPGATTFSVVEYEASVWCGMPALAAGQSAALGIGAARARPTVVTEQSVDRIVARPFVLLALAYDARAIDQRYADAFLCGLKASLERDRR